MTEEIKVNDVQELNDQMLVRREKMESMREQVRSIWYKI